MNPIASWRRASVMVIGIGVSACTTMTATSAPPLARDGGVLSFTCARGATLHLTPVVSAPSVPDLGVAAGATLPIVTAEVPRAPLAWGSTVTVEGSGFGEGGGGEYLRIGSGARETRVRASSWSDTRIAFTFPLGAEGPVSVVTKAGSTPAGSLTPNWRSSAVLGDETARRETYHTPRTILASLVTPARTLALVGVAATGAGASPRVELVAFADNAVSILPLDLPYDSVAELSARADGSVDLVSVPRYGASGALSHFHVQGDTVEADEACVPGEYGLAVMRENGRLVAWTGLPGRGTARLVHDDGAPTWTIDRGPFKSERGGAVSGHGVVGADGTVAFAWADPVGGLFDDKGIVRVAVLAPDATTFHPEDRTAALDDSVTATPFAIARGLSVAYCNHDTTGFLADTGATGSHCHVETRGATGAWQPADGYPSALDDSYDFGLVGGAIVALSNTAGDLGYVPKISGPAQRIAAGAQSARFVRGDLAAPAIVVEGTNGDLTVVRPR